MNTYGNTNIPDYELPPTTNTKRITGLARGQIYRYKVVAYNSVGESPFVNTAPSKLVAPTVTPLIFTDADYSPDQTKFRIDWSCPVDDGGTTFSGYIITATPSPGGSPITFNTSSPPPYTIDTLLAFNTPYTFTVKAVSAQGQSADSSSSSPSQQCLAPIAPSQMAAPGIQAPVTTNPPTITWTAPASNGRPITEYIIQTYQ